jgi:GT2 family glycosyltransferase
MMPNKSLSWGLVIITYKREKILPVCLELAIKQTRKPTEIIVIDASDDWETTRDTVMSEIAKNSSDIRWVYDRAEILSSTLQRNQGLQIATVDIVFLIDDDSLMYPTCAEEIMRIYEADPTSLVKGIQANAVDIPPSSDREIVDSQKPTGDTQKLARYENLRRVKDLLWENFFLMSTKKLFIPYDGDYPQYEIPFNLSHLNVITSPLFQGYRMTYRRETILQEKFEPLLRYYAAGEDLDASYRVSRQGMLLTAVNAKLHHFQSASGRLSRFKASALSALNQALFLRKYSSDLHRDRLVYYRLMARRIIAEICKDLLSRRWSLPQVRGLLVALKYAPKLFALPDEELAQWYTNLQREFLQLSS